MLIIGAFEFGFGTLSLRCSVARNDEDELQNPIGIWRYQIDKAAVSPRQRANRLALANSLQFTYAFSFS